MKNQHMTEAELELVSGGQYVRYLEIMEILHEVGGGFVEGWKDGYQVKRGTPDVSGIRPGEVMA